MPASGTLRYQHFLVPTNFEEDKWVAAAEIRPGAKGAVHHILVFVLGRGEELGTEPDPERNGRGQQLAGYVPGDIPSRYPAGMAKKIPAGARLLFQVHYTPIGKPVEDRSAIGLVFADGPVERQVLTKGIAQRSLSIPPNAPDHAVRSQYRVPAGSLLLSLSPHMHLRGKDFTYKAEYPDGRSEVLLSVPRYDFNWQTRYNLAEPKRLPAGTTIACLAHYDNSDGNKANPDPSRTVRWGPQTTDEMMIGYVDLAPDRPIDSADPDPDPDPAAPARGDRAPMMQIVESLDLDADQRQQLRGLFREYRGRYRTPEFRKAAEAILTPEQRAAWQARRREDDQPEGTRP